MKHLSKLFISIAAAFMFVGCLHGVSVDIKDPLEPDDIVYDENSVVDYEDADLIYERRNAAKTDEVTKVILHLYDEDGNILDKNGNLNRVFWFWASGAAPDKEFMPDDGYDRYNLKITLDLTQGEFAVFYKKTSISFLIKNKSADPVKPVWDYQTSNTELIFEDYPPKQGLVEVWLAYTQGNDLGIYETEEKAKMTGVKIAYFSDWKTITCQSTAPGGVHYVLYAYDQKYLQTSAIYQTEYAKSLCKIKEGEGSGSKFTITLNYSIHPNMVYTIESNELGKPDSVKFTNVTFERLYETERFETYFNYDGDLGCFYTPEETTFRVWAPTAGLMRVYLYETGTPADFEDEGGSNDHRGYVMTYKKGGVWELTIKNKDLGGQFYCYQVVNSSGKFVVMDPYATACGINGVRALIYDPSDVNPTGWDDIPLKWDKQQGYDISHPNELSIYEVHVRDLTIDETWQSNRGYKRGTYQAFAESGTTYTDGETTVTTGYDHIEEMGVKAIQIMPCFDYDNAEDEEHFSYNWGYNPLNYNCLEGAYSNDPFDPTSRITEFKQLVMAYANNKNKTRTVMDVVYNHVNSASDSNFNRLMPKYYFRFDDTWTYFMDASGCGNEVKSEAPMMRKFIVDSLCMWAREYKIKGFRFDLMGIIDFITMNKAAEELYKIDPDIYLYGEGWAAGEVKINYDYYKTWGTDSWTVYNKCRKAAKRCWIGCFNDVGRNALKGENDINGNFWGFITQGSEHVGDKSWKVADMLVGKHFGITREGDESKDIYNPNQCIVYASCHDNFSLYDQFTYTASNKGDPDRHPGITCAAVACAECTIMSSNGVAFMQGGEELFRTKEVTDYDYYNTSNAAANAVVVDETTYKWISHNSYNLEDHTNSFKWDRKISVDDVSTLGYVQQIEKAIQTRDKLTKYTYEYLEAHSPYSSASDFNVWNAGDGSTTIAFKNGNYFFFIAGVNDNDIPFGVLSNKYVDVFCSNPVSGGYIRKPGAIRLGWFTCLMLHYIA